ncbi:hypothetical protein ACFYYB_33805 [Streptomyces sp. NPDC002886]|uniref:hypothetical protein n=1 Tax=Streptomyces sp. NPDC002886 TaxID=3364667 RepID=UPI0036A4C0B5
MNGLSLGWVGDEVTDGDGRAAMVTDVRAGGTVWVLRPVYTGNFTTRWETEHPETLGVVKRRSERIANP